MRRWPLVLAIAMGWLPVACGPADGGAASDPSPGPRPDILLVLLDTLRPDHLELYGRDRTTAPFLAQLGARGTVFERAHSTSGWTPPSTASALTGLYPERHGVLHGLDTDKETARKVAAGEVALLEVPTLPPGQPTLAELLSAAGYRTFGVATNVHINTLVGYQRGFDRFQLHADADADRVLQQLDAWGPELAGDGPRFLYLHLNDVHRPHDQRLPWYQPVDDQRADLVESYDSEISWLDSRLAQLFEAQPWLQDAVVCVVSDHGEGFGERFAGVATGEHGFYGHGPNLNWVVNRCVFLLHGPGVPALRVDRNVSLVDVLPTLLELAGVDAPSDLDGLSLLPLLTEADADTRAELFDARPLFAHRKQRRGIEGQPMWAVMQGRWKLVHDEFTGTTALYDTVADGHEQHDLAAAQPERVAQMLSLRASHAARGSLGPGQVDVTLDEHLLQALRELGYAGDDDRH